MNVETVDIREIRDSITELNRNTSNLIGRFDMHIVNKAIHHDPPCRAHRELSGRLYAVAVMAFGGLMTAVWGIFSKGH